jgi:hypothetical protein
MCEFISHYSILNDMITQNDIFYIENYKYNFVYIKNRNFNGRLDMLPICTLHLEINSENYKIYDIPEFVKWLSIYNCKKVNIIPSSVLILEFTTSILKNNPYILNIIPYGVKSIIININNDCNEINLDNLPESIETIHIINSFDLKFNINITKYFPNLKWLAINKSFINKDNDHIKKYLILHYNDDWVNKICDTYNPYENEHYYNMVIDGIRTD